MLKPHDFSQQITLKLLPRWTFDPIIGSRHGIANKPDPAGALEAAALMKLKPAECVFIGDTYADMRTAVSAGMLPIGVLWGFREAQELIDSGAKFLIDHPMKLLDLLGPA